MKIIITRSFSKKVQLKQFEPIDSFCSAQWEFESLDQSFDSIWNDLKTRKIIITRSEELDKFCQTEVGKTLEKLRPSLIKESGQDKLKVADVSVDEAENDE